MFKTGLRHIRERVVAAVAVLLFCIAALPGYAHAEIPISYYDINHRPLSDGVDVNTLQQGIIVHWPIGNLGVYTYSHGLYSGKSSELTLLIGNGHPEGDSYCCTLYILDALMPYKTYEIGVTLQDPNDSSIWYESSRFRFTTGPGGVGGEGEGDSGADNGQGDDGGQGTGDDNIGGDGDNTDPVDNGDGGNDSGNDDAPDNSDINTENTEGQNSSDNTNGNTETNEQDSKPASEHTSSIDTSKDTEDKAQDQIEPEKTEPEKSVKEDPEKEEPEKENPFKPREDNTVVRNPIEDIINAIGGSKGTGSGNAGTKTGQGSGTNGTTGVSGAANQHTDASGTDKLNSSDTGSTKGASTYTPGEDKTNTNQSQATGVGGSKANPSKANESTSTPQRQESGQDVGSDDKTITQGQAGAAKDAEQGEPAPAAGEDAAAQDPAAEDAPEDVAAAAEDATADEDDTTQTASDEQGSLGHNGAQLQAAGLTFRLAGTPTGEQGELNEALGEAASAIELQITGIPYMYLFLVLLLVFAGPVGAALRATTFRHHLHTPSRLG